MDYHQAQRCLDQLLEQGEIEPATHRCGLDLLKTNPQSTDQGALNCASAETLEQWARKNALRWQDNLEVEAFGERFEVGHGHTYGCIEQMLSCIDHAFLVELLNQLEAAAAQPSMQGLQDSSQGCC